MKITFRALAFSIATAGLAMTLGAAPAFAKTHHTKHHAKAHHQISNAATIIRIAQQHLSNLGYYKGKVDGVMGPKTRAAIKKFQKDHALKADGVLGPKTNAALAAADPTHEAFMTHEEPNSSVVVFSPPTVGGTSVSVNPDYATSLNGTTKTLSSRFATLEVTENGQDAQKTYSIMMNGSPLIIADGQPSVIGISPTYNLGEEEAVVFTTYNDKDAGCRYGSHLLVLNNTGYRTIDVANCTRHYEAYVKNGSLYLTFTEPDDNRDVGATWRLQGVDLQRL